MNLARVRCCRSLPSISLSAGYLLNTFEQQKPKNKPNCYCQLVIQEPVHHSPVFDFEGHGFDVWLVVEAGEIDFHFVMANDLGFGHVLSKDGVLEH